jgi:hypothetical protein
VADVHLVVWSLSDGSAAFDTLNPAHAYGDNGVYTVTLTATDDDGGVGSDTLRVTVHNVAPAVDAWATPTVALPRQPVAFASTVTDPGWLDTHTITWDYGDGSPPLTASGGGATWSITVTHAYDLGGVYTATLDVADDDGGTAQAVVSVGVCCELYPIALHVDTIAGAEVGEELVDVLNGTGPGNFGWLSWAGSPNVPTLAKSLTFPGDSDTYANPNDPKDGAVSVGNWVQGSPGVNNAASVRDALDALEGEVITVPVWDEATRPPVRWNWRPRFSTRAKHSESFVLDI